MTIVCEEPYCEKPLGHDGACGREDAPDRTARLVAAAREAADRLAEISNYLGPFDHKLAFTLITETLTKLRAALKEFASAPSAEPEGPDYSGLCSAPECGGHCGYTHAVGCEVIREYLAEHGGAPYKAPARTAHLAPSAPTPRDMRVAEAWEAFQPHLDAAEEALARGIQWDGDTMQVLYEARAVVAKALEVGT